MRVLFWSELFWPHVGGVEILAAQTVAGLCGRGHDVKVITSHDDSLRLPDTGEHGEATVHRMPFRAAVGARDVGALIELRRRVRELKAEWSPDLIHLFGLGPSAMFHLQTLAASSAPVLVTTHGEVLRGGADRGETVVEKTLASATWVVCVSSAVLAAARALRPDVDERSSLLYSGVQPTAPSGKSSREQPFILCIGRFVPDKGFDTAVDAFSAVATELPELRLVMAGDGPTRTEVRRRAEAAGLGDRIDFPGWVDSTEVADLLAGAALLVMPSRREGLPLVAIQAAQMGIPVVGTTAGGLPEVVIDGKSGLLVAPEDARALAASISVLLRDESARQRMGAAARQRAKEMFGWQRYLDATEALYEKLVAGPPA